jgi:hypothetical protein
MAPSNNKDPKLSEVKAVLQRLQGFETEPGAATKNPARRERRSGRGAAIATGFIILATAGGLLGAAYRFVRPNDHVPGRPVAAENPKEPTEAVPPPSSPATQEPAAVPASQRLDSATPDAKGTLERARALMAKGKVRAAREQLLVLANKGSPDAAWDLARSYDPNVLAGLPADAAPDVKEATRWYRTWYAAAVREGLVADSVSLERIIGSMRQ